jgi:hypothetical protein
MPIHDWTRVPDGVCRTLHLSWCARLKQWLNEELLPPEQYAMLEPAVPAPVDGFHGPTIGEVLQQADVTDVAEPILLTTQTTAEVIGRNVVVIRAEEGDRVIEVIRLPLRPAFPLPERSIVLGHGAQVSLPLEETYASACETVPHRWRRVIEGG